MGKVLFKHIHIENFCNHKEFDADLFNKTIISGYNKQGKTSILNAILFVLTNKLQNGADAGDSIRQHDQDGNRIDNTVIRIDLTTNIDGLDFVLTKIQKQKWVKKRGNNDAEFQGNENQYEISGIPKKAKDFEQFINDNICPIDKILYCMNANGFLVLDNKKRRNLVLSLAKSFTDDDVIATDLKFEELRNDLKIGTVEELMKRSKQTNTTLKKTLEELPARIDEASKQIVDLPFSELELEKKSLDDDLANIALAEKAKADIESQIMQAKFDLNEIENRIISKAKDKQNEIRFALMELKNKQRIANDEAAKYESEKEKELNLIKNNEVAIKEAEKQKEIASERIFDDSSLVCPTCGQNYPADKEKEIRERFEKNRQDEMSRLVDYIDTLKNGLQTAKCHVEEYEKLIAEKRDVASSLDTEIQDKEIWIAGITLDDPTKDASYKAKQDEITALQAKADKYLLDNSKAEINSKIKEIERKLAQAEANNRAEERIAQLKAEQKVVAQNILNQERIIALLEDYNKAKIGMLEDSVNAYFEIIKWRFFEKQINGGYAEVCKATVDGEDYNGLLNKSDRLLCQLDLVRGFQKAYGVNLPLAMDDTESVDAERIPDVEDHQMILFKRDDCKLKVDEWS